MLCNSGTNTFLWNPVFSRGLLSKSFDKYMINTSPVSDNAAKRYRGRRTDQAFLIILMMSVGGKFENTPIDTT